MKFLLLYRTSNKDVEAGVPPSDQEIAAMGKLMEEMGKAGVLLSTEGLKPSSKGTRVRMKSGNFIVSDGPFTDVKENIAGYALV
ncbi:MAG TPA: YciI family protein [Anaeromyxobacter sp.]